MVHGRGRSGLVGWATLAAAVLWFACAGNAHAETKQWSGDNGAWDVPGNWTPAGVPSSTDDAKIDSGTPEVSAADATVGSIEVSSGLRVTGDRTLTVSGPATSTIAADVALSHGTLRLDGTTVWSAGWVLVTDAGAVENAGVLEVSGAGVGMDETFGAGPPGRLVFSVLAGGVTAVSGSLEVKTELEVDGTLRVLDGGSLVQSGEVATPGDSRGVFDAQGSGVLSLSNVSMGAGSSATGSGTIRFAGGTSHVLTAANYDAGITDLGDGGVLDLQADAMTGALWFSGPGTRGGAGRLTVGSGVSSLGQGTFRDGGVTAFTPGSRVSIADDVTLRSTTAGPTVQLDGAAAWSAGQVLIMDAGALENAGLLQVTGTDVAVDSTFASGAAGRLVFGVLAGGVTEVSGSLAVHSEIEDDGTLRVSDGGSLVQSNEVATPGDSGGVFDAQGSGVLSLSNVTMGAGSSATGSGTIRFAGGTSHVLGTAYAAGVTDLGDGGILDLQADATTGALRFSGSGTRGGAGRLTVGSGVSSLGQGTFRDGGATEFTPASRVTISDNVTLRSTTAGPTLRLDGAAVWSAGHVVIIDAGVVENAGLLQVTAAGARVDESFGSGATGPRGLRNTTGTIELGAGTTLALAGDYTQGANATLLPRIASATQYGRLTAGGTAALDGTLQLATSPGFAPAATDTFRIVDAGTRAGTFATVAGGQATAAERYIPVYDATGLTLAVGLGPANSVPPSIPASGDPGEAVTCNPGTWSGSPTFGYAWLRDGAQIASGPTYTLAAGDAGRSIVCRVTASDANGSSQADSNALRPPAAAPEPSPAPTPTGPPPPVTGKTVNVAAERGTVTVRLPGGTTVPIDDATQIVTGSVVDTRAGAVRLSVSAGGKLQTGVFSDGLFRVTQSTGKHPVTELQLVEKLDCSPAKGARAATKKKKRRRSLWGDAKGSFRTRGQYGSAVNTGTKWLTEDRCDGTLFRVARGVIKVTPNGSHRSVLVRAGRQYLVRRRS